ncbi:hypothetical protein [Streptomyces umbrinus]|uniref:hypothetical protein n=1 Tax=Streptomyces umbrinus TaxID=67370 RepID=UPI00340CB3C0
MTPRHEITVAPHELTLLWLTPELGSSTWARHRDHRFARFLTARMVEAEVPGGCRTELETLAGARDVLETWLAQRELASTVDDELLAVQVSALGWTLRSIAHSVWAGHPEWELAFHPAATRPPVDPIKALARANAESSQRHPPRTVTAHQSS